MRVVLELASEKIKFGICYHGYSWSKYKIKVIEVKVCKPS
jgi:hypothetical protein